MAAATPEQSPGEAVKKIISLDLSKVGRRPGVAPRYAEGRAQDNAEIRGCQAIVDRSDPFIDADGTVGFAIYRPDGTVEVNSLEEWKSKEPTLGKLLDELASSKEFGRLWKLPSYPIDWNEPEYDGKLLLNIVREIDEFVDLPGDGNEYLNTLAVYIVFSYLHFKADVWPRLLLYGRTKTGKSRVLDLLYLLCYRAFKTSYPTPAVIYRMIERYGVTFLIDEIQKMKRDKERWDAIMNLYLCGYDGTPIVRTNNDNSGIDMFFTATPIAASSKDDALTEDAENRSIIYNMQPRTRKLRGRPSESRYPQFAALRGELLALRLQVASGQVDYGEFVRQAEEMLEGDEVEIDGQTYALDDRARDIGRALLPVALMFGVEDDLLKVINDSEVKSKDELRSTLEARVFYAVQALFIDYYEVDENDRHRPKKKREGSPPFWVKEVFDKVQVMMAEEGDEPKYPLRQARVTRALSRGLGFNIGRGTGNKPYIKAEGFIESYNKHYADYGHYSEDSSEIGKKQKTEKIQPVLGSFKE